MVEATPIVTAQGGIPRRLAPLIGRDAAITAACAFLRQPEIALLTLVGPGGVGKTSLALRVAAAISTDPLFADGVVFVPLATVGDPERVPTAIAEALDLRDDAQRSPGDVLISFLRTKQVLLLLDNCEQILAAAPAVASLLAACPGVKILATSRAAFHLAGEQELPVAPLAIPVLDTADTADLLNHPAPALFLARARAIRPDFVPTPADARAIVAICARLDGLPLAIELAAARIRLLSPSALLARLERPFPLLANNTSTLPARQQTMRAAIAWSYGLLNPDEQALFRRLAVFVGGCDLAAVEALGTLCDTPRSATTSPILDLLASLVDKHLLLQETAADGEPRLAALALIREFALEELAASGEERAIRHAHATHFLALVEGADERLQGPDQLPLLERLEREHDNLRTALDFAVAEGDAPTALRLGRALWRFWYIRSHFREGLHRLEAILALTGSTDPTLAVLRAQVLAAAGLLAFYQGDYGRAATHCGQGLAAGQELGDARSQALALWGLAVVARNTGDAPGSRTLHEQGLALARACDDQVLIVEHLQYLGTLEGMVGDIAAARRVLEESLAICRSLGDRRGTAAVLGMLGTTLCEAGEFATARAFLLEALPVATAMGERRIVGRILQRLGDTAFEAREYARAERWYRDGLAIMDLIGDRWFVAVVLDRLAGLATAVEEPRTAARLFGAAAAARDAIGVAMPIFNRGRYERDLAATRAALGEETFSSTFLLGRTQRPDEALAATGTLTLTEPSQPGTTISSAQVPGARTQENGPDQLSPREIEVLRLVASGLTDAQVAAHLFLSTRTVNAHLRTIYQKLDLPSRSAATRWAATHGLV